jgi:hypothetical protein
MDIPAEAPMTDNQPSIVETPAPPNKPIVEPGAAESSASVTEPVRTARPLHRRALAIGAAASAGVLVVAGVAATLGAAPAPVSTTLGTTDLGAAALSTDGTRATADTGWVLAGGGSGDAGGFGRHGGMPGLRSIEVTAINGTSVSLRTEDGWTRTVTVTEDVTITKAGVEIELGALSVGDTVRLRQTRNDDGTWTVTGIVVVVPTTVGTVTAVDADSITIRGRNGTTEEIATTSSTVYRLGPNAGARSDVVVGAVIVAAGTEDAAGKLTATTVVVELARVGGQVTAKSSSTITIEQRDGSSLTIHVDGDTDYTVAGDEDATLADVTVEMWLVASGEERSDGSFDAATVRAAAEGQGLGRGFGFGRGHHHGWDHGEITPDAGTDSDTDSSTS